MVINRIEIFDFVLIRLGRIDWKIEFFFFDEKIKRRIFIIYINCMILAEDVNIDDYVMVKDDLFGVDIKV